MNEIDTSGLRKLADMRRQNGQTRTADALTSAADEIDRLRTTLCTKAHAHIDGAHVGGLVEGCMLCDVMKERDGLRARVAELERDAAHFKRTMEIRAAEREQSAKQIEHLARVLGSIHMVLYPEIQKIEGGQSLRFMPPNPHDYVQMLSDKIRAIPAELAAIDAAKAPGIASGKITVDDMPRAFVECMVTGQRPKCKGCRGLGQVDDGVGLIDCLRCDGTGKESA